MKIDDLQVYEQSSSYCGPACVKIVLDGYGIKRSERYLADLINASRENGCSARPIVSAVRKINVPKKYGYNFGAYFRNRCSLKDLEVLIGNGIPPIVNWCLDENDGVEITDGDGGHYSVVSGITRRNITLIDTLIGAERVMRREDFYRKWYDYYGKRLRGDNSNLIKRRMIVIYPKF